MTTTSGSHRRDSAPAPGRDLGIDVARGVAVVAMFVAHFAPGGGPGGVLDLSEYLTAPLFALLIGWGAQLGLGRRREVWSVAVRAVVLVGVGLLLERAGAQIVVVLVWLGVLTVLAALVVRLPSVAVLVVGALSFALAPRGRTWARDWVLDRLVAGEPTDGLLARVVDVTVGGANYRLSEMLPVACLGILLARHPGRLVTLGTLLVAAAGSLVLAVGLAVGRVDMLEYTGTPLVMVFDLCLAVAVVQAGRTLGPRLGAPARLVATVGAMTLTVYVLQVLAAARYVADRPPGATDNSWALLAAMVVGAFALAAAWPRVVRRAPWSRGPVEGVVRAVVDVPVPGR